jgi:hypothetical protein
VQLTPIYSEENNLINNLTLYSTEVIDNKFRVYSSKDCKFFWHAYATREYINTEPLKNEVCVEGNGPYRYLINKN